MLNIASVNMPTIKPETKVLIIKNLKSKSPAEVADIFNVSKRQVERICLMLFERQNITKK